MSRDYAGLSRPWRVAAWVAIVMWLALLVAAWLVLS